LPSFTFWHYTNQIIIIIINIDRLTLHPSFPFLHKPPLSEGIENVQTNLQVKWERAPIFGALAKQSTTAGGTARNGCLSPLPVATHLDLNKRMFALLFSGMAMLTCICSNLINASSSKMQLFKRLHEIHGTQLPTIIPLTDRTRQ